MEEPYVGLRLFIGMPSTSGGTADGDWLEDNRHALAAELLGLAALPTADGGVQDRVTLTDWCRAYISAGYILFLLTVNEPELTEFMLTDIREDIRSLSQMADIYEEKLRIEQRAAAACRGNATPPEASFDMEGLDVAFDICDALKGSRFEDYCVRANCVGTSLLQRLERK